MCVCVYVYVCVSVCMRTRLPVACERVCASANTVGL